MCCWRARASCGSRRAGTWSASIWKLPSRSVLPAAVPSPCSRSSCRQPKQAWSRGCAPTPIDPLKLEQPPTSGRRPTAVIAMRGASFRIWLEAVIEVRGHEGGLVVSEPRCGWPTVKLHLKHRGVNQLAPSAYASALHSARVRLGHRSLSPTGGVRDRRVAQGMGRPRVARGAAKSAAAAAPVGQHRKQIAVLFPDVSGFTALRLCQGKPL